MPPIPKDGAKKTFIATLVLWCIAVILIYGTNPLTDKLNMALGTDWKSQNVFLVIGCIAGLGLGATQSACRAMVGYFSPESKSGEFFGLWNLAGKLSAIVGLISLGFLQTFFGLQKAILICAGFFFIAILIIIFVDEKKGRASAVAHEGL